MPYFDSALSQETFRVIGSRLKAEIDRAQPRLHTIAEEQASKPRSAGKWTRQQILGHLIDSAANNHQATCQKNPSTLSTTIEITKIGATRCRSLIEPGRRRTIWAFQPP